MLNNPNPVRTPLGAMLPNRTFKQRAGDAFQAFYSTFFGPLPPVQPNQEIAKERPRQFQYTPGSNIVWTPRASENLTPFSWMIQIAELYDTASMCIQARCDEMVSYEWDIVPFEKKSTPSETMISEAKDFLSKPDRVTPWNTWVGMALEEVLVTDALTISRQRTRKGQTISLELIDGSTTKPLMDASGRTPIGKDVPAYQQIMYGQVIGEYTYDEMLYAPKNRRTRSMYGKSPTEHLIMTINRALRRQSFDLSYYTDGNVPEAIISLPDLDPDSIEVIQNWFDEILSAPHQRRRVHFIPGQSRLQPYEFKKPILDPVVEEFLDKRVMGMYGVMPQALGYSEDSNRATAGVQENVELRRRLPYLRFISSLMTEELHRNGWTEVRMQFLAEKPEEDRFRQAQIDDIYLKAGKTSIDELRIRDNQEPYDFEVGPYVLTGSGPVPLKAALEGGERTMDATAENLEKQAKAPIPDPNAIPDEPPERRGNHTQQRNPSHNEGDRAMQDEEKMISVERSAAETEVRHWERWATRHLDKSPEDFVFHEVPTEIAVKLALSFERASDHSAIRLAALNALDTLKLVEVS